jgi:hypothetical protein
MTTEHMGPRAYDSFLCVLRTSVVKTPMPYVLVLTAIGVLTCAVTVIWARRKVFLYECYFHRPGKDVPVLRS